LAGAWALGGGEGKRVLPVLKRREKGLSVSLEKEIGADPETGVLHREEGTFTTGQRIQDNRNHPRRTYLWKRRVTGKVSMRADGKRAVSFTGKKKKLSQRKGHSPERGGKSILNSEKSAAKERGDQA